MNDNEINMLSYYVAFRHCLIGRGPDQRRWCKINNNDKTRDKMTTIEYIWSNYTEKICIRACVCVSPIFHSSLLDLIFQIQSHGYLSCSNNAIYICFITLVCRFRLCALMGMCVHEAIQCIGFIIIVIIYDFLGDWEGNQNIKGTFYLHS